MKTLRPEVSMYSLTKATLVVYDSHGVKKEQRNMIKKQCQSIKKRRPAIYIAHSKQMDGFSRNANKQLTVK